MKVLKSVKCGMLAISLLACSVAYAFNTHSGGTAQVTTVPPDKHVEDIVVHQAPPGILRQRELQRQRVKPYCPKIKVICRLPQPKDTTVLLATVQEYAVMDDKSNYSCTSSYHLTQDKLEDLIKRCQMRCQMHKGCRGSSIEVR